MFPSAQAVHAPPRVPPSTSASPQEPGALPRDTFGAVEDEDHIVVLGGQGPALMCALLRAGAPNVTHLRAHERPEAGSASLLVAPRLPSLDWLAAVLPSIRRGMAEGGRLVIHTGTQSSMQTPIRRMLILHGLRSIRVTADGAWLIGDLPRRPSI
jgi:hypothetical protein